MPRDPLAPPLYSTDPAFDRLRPALDVTRATLEALPPSFYARALGALLELWLAAVGLADEPPLRRVRERLAAGQQAAAATNWTQARAAFKRAGALADGEAGAALELAARLVRASRARRGAHQTRLDAVVPTLAWQLLARGAAHADDVALRLAAAVAPALATAWRAPVAPESGLDWRLGLWRALYDLALTPARRANAPYGDVTLALIVAWTPVVQAGLPPEAGGWFASFAALAAGGDRQAVWAWADQAEAAVGRRSIYVEDQARYGAASDLARELAELPRAFWNAGWDSRNDQSPLRLAARVAGLAAVPERPRLLREMMSDTDRARFGAGFEAAARRMHAAAQPLAPDLVAVAAAAAPPGAARGNPARARPRRVLRAAVAAGGWELVGLGPVTALEYAGPGGRRYVARPAPRRR